MVFGKQGRQEIHGDNFSLRGLSTGVGKRWSGNCADDGNEAQCVSERQAYLQYIPCCSFFVGQGPWRVTMLSPTGYHHGIHDMMVVQKQRHSCYVHGVLINGEDFSAGGPPPGFFSVWCGRLSNEWLLLGAQPRRC